MTNRLANASGLADARVQIRVLVTAVNAAIALTANIIWPNIPNELYITWGSVLMAGLGVVEGMWDANKT